MKKYYIETSALNHLTNIMTGYIAEETTKYQLSKNRIWFISTTVLWELMQIQDEKDYDFKLFISTYLFFPKLIKSPSEIIIDYFEKDCPDYQELENPYTESKIGKYWEKACNERSFSFSLENSDFMEITRTYKKISKKLPFLYKKEDVEDSDEDIMHIRLTIDKAYDEYFKDNVEEVVVFLRRIAIILLYIHICCEIDIATDVIHEYWNKKGVYNTEERLRYILNKNINILRVGPLWNMANTILHQTYNQRSSRGALHDGLHSIYLPFVDVFLTNDSHFLKLRNSVEQIFLDKYYKKIEHLDELEIKDIII